VEELVSVGWFVGIKLFALSFFFLFLPIEKKEN
jgi:hypothetical protein